MLDQSSTTVHTVLPSLLSVVELMSPLDYNSLVRHDMKKLLHNTASAEVIVSMTHARHYVSTEQWL